MSELAEKFGSLGSDLLASVLFDIVDRMQLPAAGVFPWARAGELCPWRGLA
jgi:hypothetical protein